MSYSSIINSIGIIYMCIFNRGGISFIFHDIFDNLYEHDEETLTTHMLSKKADNHAHAGHVMSTKQLLHCCQPQE
jgi:hypothetical protein